MGSGRFGTGAAEDFYTADPAHMLVFFSDEIAGLGEVFAWIPSRNGEGRPSRAQEDDRWCFCRQGIHQLARPSFVRRGQNGDLEPAGMGPVGEIVEDAEIRVGEEGFLGLKFVAQVPSDPFYFLGLPAWHAGGSGAVDIDDSETLIKADRTDMPRNKVLLI